MARTRDDVRPRQGDGTTGRPGLATGGLADAVGGLYGAAAMSVLRLALHRAGLVDKMVPHAVEEWMSDRLNIDPPGGTAGHHVADELLHLAYGAGLGALGGPMVSGRETRGGLWHGTAFGLASWAFGCWFWSPLCAWRGPPGRQARWKTRPISPLTWFSDGPSSWSSKNPPRQRDRGHSSDAERIVEVECPGGDGENMCVRDGAAVAAHPHPPPTEVSPAGQRFLLPG